MPNHLSLTLKRIFGRERLTLSLETNKVHLAVAHGRRILRGVEAALSPDVMQDGQLVDTAAFGQIIAQLVDRTKAPSHQTIVSLNEQRAMVRILTLPPVPTQLLPETVLREARRELPLPLEQLYLSWQVINPGNTTRLQVFMVAVPRDVLDNYVIGLQLAGIQPAAMELRSLALVRAVNQPHVILLDLNTNAASVVLVRNFIPYIVRPITLLADQAKLLTERADQLIAEIQRTLDFYNTTMAATHPSWSPAICLTGDVEDADPVRDRIGSRWPLVEPDPPLQLPPNLALRPYLANIGLALKNAV